MSNTSVVGFTTAYDRASNKFFERHLHAESRSHLCQPLDEDGLPTGGYDSLDRLRQYQRGILAEGGGSVDTPISLPNTDVSHQYVLDGVGNWRRNIAEPVGGSLATEVRQHNSLNQITQYGSTPCTYDRMRTELRTRLVYRMGCEKGEIEIDGELGATSSTPRKRSKTPRPKPAGFTTPARRFKCA